MASKEKGRGRVPGRTVAYRPQRREEAAPARIAWNRAASAGHAGHSHPEHQRIPAATAVFIIAAVVALAGLMFFFFVAGRT